MRIEVTTRIVVTDEIGRHLVTAEISDRKDVGGNPRFFFPESTPVVDGVSETALMTAARGLDRSRAEVSA